MRRGTLIVATVCAGMSALVAVQYQTTFEGSLDASGLRALAENPAIRILFGPPVALDDAGGFTVWRTGLPLLVLASVWILLAATRITRGEEDAGRFDLLLAGRLRMVEPDRCAAWSAVTGAALVISAAVGVSSGRRRAPTPPARSSMPPQSWASPSLSPRGAVLAAQIMPTRSARSVSPLACSVVALLVRMLADGAPALAW